MTGLRPYVADMLHRPNARRDVRIDASHLDGVSVAATVLDPDEPLILTATLECVADGIVVRGRVTGRWQAPCACCLIEAGGPLDCSISELFEANPIEGETYQLGDDEIDLEPAVRDAVLPELPAAPRCRDDCQGLCAGCGADRNVADCECDPEPPDPRWDALAELRLSS
ncbi:MAG TPA: DUF177 domain-containing protein [Acidimicrobiia bacterium]|nr:DUF177 domain-containing protein [Acidimicrobiia bacterium]